MAPLAFVTVGPQGKLCQPPHMLPHQSRKKRTRKSQQTNPRQYQLKNQENDKAQPVEKHIRCN